MRSSAGTAVDFGTSIGAVVARTALAPVSERTSISA